MTDTQQKAEAVALFGECKQVTGNTCVSAWYHGTAKYIQVTTLKYNKRLQILPKGFYL